MKPIGLDTNALLNYRLKREPGFEKVLGLIKNCLDGKVQLYIPLPAILEVEWVLRSFYKQTKEEIISFLDNLLLVENISVDFKNELKVAINLYQDKNAIKLTDAVILVLVLHKNYDFLTFDKDLQKVYQSLI
jgi:predicted nucleic-acid-binding protein